MKKILNILVLALLPSANLLAQATGILSGLVTDKQSQLPLAGASIILGGTGLGAISDSSGRFRLTGIPAKSYNISISQIGYKTVTRYNVIISSGNEQVISFELEPTGTTLSTVIVSSRKRNARAASIETPLSVQKLTTEEIKSNPGGNFDISRVIQSLPGVGGTSGSVGGYRNDIIIRGGAPNENVYYLDGIEVPVINHFATEGSAGGPTGILNVSFIDEVKLSSSAFDARYDNAISSVLQFRQKNGNANRTQGNFRLSATEFAAMLEGPLSKKENITYMASVRRSYLQFLFSAIDLPIRPNYWDFQTKVNYPINKKLNLSFIGIGAIDEFSYAYPKKASPEKLYILNATPSINQDSYTIGLSLKKIIPKGFWNIALSRNNLNNELDKFEDNNEPVEAERILGIRSRETENKLRFDVNQSFNGWKVAYGAMAQLVDYDNNTYNVIRKELKDENGAIIQPEEVVNFTSPFSPMLKMGAFAQVSKRMIDNRLGLSAGMRIDRNDFTDDGRSLFKTLSPRLSLSYNLSAYWTANISAGRYFKIPPYTILGFADNNGVAVNRSAKYLQSDHITGGVEYMPGDATRFTLEGFYKLYDNVPVSVRNGISLSNLGGDFNVLGNEEITTNGKGKTYGFEFFAQQKLTKRFFGILSYTFFRSRYSGADGILIPSSWDNRHLLSLTWGYKFKRNWELGLKFRFQGGAPFTPFDEEASRKNYLSQGTGQLNYAALNTLRLNNFNSGDVRIDKKWNFKRTSLDLFLDVTNWYGSVAPAYPKYTFKRNADNTDYITTDGQPIKPDGSNAIPIILKNEDATVVPTIGFIVEF
ncbi:TonB-dependent receptor [Flavihumibacter profundi]|uniref:TonB-dependent receptor n=1 Tax=Flavihumibacter profundi TaxID=2716883 RepID=UPI001CC39255|nr:TonB-dependent receptor [Flavihumibacter profundi]MBZ5855718.1 TonB-dependent receptor [Flavihumibacter profundi]